MNEMKVCSGIRARLATAPVQGLAPSEELGLHVPRYLIVGLTFRPQTLRERERGLTIGHRTLPSIPSPPERRLCEHVESQIMRGILR